MKHLLLVAVLLAGACSGSDDPAPVPTSTSVPSTAAARATPSTTEPESRSGLLSEQLVSWSELGIADYDLEYVLVREGGDDSGTYRTVVRDGEAVNCYRDEVLSLAMQCDGAYYSVESLFERIISGDARLAEVVYDEEWHFPASVDHDPVASVDEAYTVEVVSFAPQDPVDWVAYVEVGVDWLEANYDGEEPVDWDLVREEALRLVSAVPRQINAFAGISQAVLMVPGAFLVSARQRDGHDGAVAAMENFEGEPPSGDRLEGDVGYLLVTAATSNLWATYAPSVHGLMRDVASEPVCGWVVDGREAWQFDLAREVLALGPLLGGGDVLTRTLADVAEVWSYESGAVAVNGVAVGDLRGEQGVTTEGLVVEVPFTPGQPYPPVALLTSQGTSGWVIAGFSGRSNTQSFGEPAPGLLAYTFREGTIVKELPLGERIHLWLAPDVVNRLGEAPAFRPDQMVLPIPDSGVDEVLEVALVWLNGQPSCATGDAVNG